MTAPVYVFAGGGTGGHLYPGLAVAQRVRELQADAQIVFACSDRAIDRKILDPTDYAVVPQSVRPIPRRLGGVWPFLRCWFASRKQAADLMADLKPAAVLGLGGFAAGPVVQQACRSRVRAGLLNPDAVPGRANRYLAGFVQAIFTQFPQTGGCFPSSQQGKVRAAGCPIRSEFGAASRQSAVEHLGLDPQRKTLLVFGGSLLAESLSEAIGALAAELGELAGQWQVVHISGSPKAAQIDKMLLDKGLTVRSLAYCDRMELAYAAADLALCRAGAVTVAELTATGTPSVLMPYPHHKDQHQKLNAAALVGAGAGVLVEDVSDPQGNAAHLRRSMLPILRDAAGLEAMRAAAAGLGRAEAAREVARWLVEGR